MEMPLDWPFRLPMTFWILRVGRRLARMWAAMWKTGKPRIRRSWVWTVQKKRRGPRLKKRWLRSNYLMRRRIHSAHWRITLWNGRNENPIDKIRIRNHPTYPTHRHHRSGEKFCKEIRRHKRTPARSKSPHDSRHSDQRSLWQA